MTPAPAITVEGSAHVAGRPLFAPLGFYAGAGEWTCLLGPSGIGKSTILRLIAGLETGATFNGIVAADDGQPLAGRIAWMAQSDLLLPWLDVTGNVMLGPRLRGTGSRAARSRARDLIARVGLGNDDHKRPAELSGGMRQRAALARTLMEDQPIILLDEAFSALDARTRAEMHELAWDLLAGRTVVMVTHDPAEAARLGHRIDVLTEAGLTHADPPATPPLRPHDDPATLTAQAALLTQLREAA